VIGIHLRVPTNPITSLERPGKDGTKVEPTDVRIDPLGWNTASHPKCVLPLAGTIVPSVLPSNRTGSIPGPGQYANVQTAVAPRVLNPSSSRFKPRGVANKQKED